MGVVDTIKSWVNELLEGLVNRITSSVSDLLDEIGISFDSLISPLTQIFSNISDGIRDAFLSVTDTVSSLFYNLSDVVHDAMTDVVDGIASAFHGLAGYVEGALTYVWDTLSEVGISILEGFDSLRQTLLEVLSFELDDIFEVSRQFNNMISNNMNIFTE